MKNEKSFWMKNGKWRMKNGKWIIILLYNVRIRLFGISLSANIANRQGRGRPVCLPFILPLSALVWADTRVCPYFGCSYYAELTTELRGNRRARLPAQRWAACCAAKGGISQREMPPWRKRLVVSWLEIWIENCSNWELFKLRMENGKLWFA